MDDRELLTRYISTSSQDAFAELVHRNADLVYSSALRQLNGDEHLAQDVTQAVFFLLARKAKTVRRTVPGFLLWTTHFACRDARKLAIRRAYHERRAGAMRLDAQTEETPDWETYAPALDAALMRLPGKDRDAVALRYFRGMNLKDVGQTLGISEEAARKRVSRATDRLRALIRESTTVPAAPILAQQLALHATQPAPSGVVASIASGTIQSGTLPAAIASKAAAAIALAKLKFAAILLLIFTLAAAAGGGVFVLVQMNSAATSSPASSSASPTVVPTPEVPELTIPGQIQLVRWEAVLNDAGAKAMNDLLTPLNTDSKVFRAATANGAELRALVNSLRLQGNTTNLPNLLSFATEQSKGTHFFSSFFYATFMNDPNGETVNGRIGHLGGFTRTDANHLHFDVNYRDFKLLSLVVNGGVESWSNFSTASIVADTNLTAGDAIAFTADLTDNNKTYHRLIVWETFKATPYQMPFFQQLSISWWCLHGPSQLRTWADQTLAWQSRAKHATEVVAPEYEKKLSDGKIVRLIGFNRGTEGPYRWWDPHGDPVVGLSDQIPLYGNPTNLLVAAVEVVGTAAEKSLSDPLNNQPSPPGNNPFDQTQVLRVERPASNLDAGVLVGPWIDCGDLPPNKKVAVGGENFRVETNWPGNVAFNARLTLTGGRDFDDFISAIPRDGQEIAPENVYWVSMILLRRSRLPQTQSLFGVYRLPSDNVKTFHLYRRKREWVTFNNISLIPQPFPPQTAPPQTSADQTSQYPPASPPAQ